MTLLMILIAAYLAWVIVYGIVRVPFIASFFMMAVLTGGDDHRLRL
jgi:hypothetical protein